MTLEPSRAPLAAHTVGVAVSNAGAFLVTFDGRPLPARPGQTVAAALVAQGIRSWRLTRHARRPRGLFCGIGLCFDCLVIVNGVPNQRACLTVLAPGDSICTQEGVG